jgi:pimeloyl-ACP methyl ester carboxylesterase
MSIPAIPSPSSDVPPHRWHGEGSPLVLISGLGGKGTSWHPFLSCAAERFRVLTFDNRGAGEAPAIDGPITVRDLALDALRLLDHLGLERVAVMGRSMGGMIAQELALLAPERVSALGLVCTAARSDAKLAGIFELWAGMAEQGVSAELRHRCSMAFCLGQEFVRDEERSRRYLEAKSASDRPRDYARQAHACARHDALDRLHRIAAPTLVVSGTDDRLTPPPYAEELAKAIAGADLRYIHGAGHLAYLEAPDEFARVALRFLETHAAPRSAEEPPPHE